MYISMGFVIVVVVGLVVGATLVRLGYIRGRTVERQRWKQRGHSIWDREQR